MSEPAEMSVETVRADRDPAVEEIARALGLAPGAAQRLLDAGHRSSEEVRRLSDEALREIGLTDSEVARVQMVREAQAAEPPPATGAAPARTAVSGEKIVERWLDSVRKGDRPRRRHVAVPAKDSTAVLKRWVEGDDRAMEAWIQASEAVRPPAPAPKPPAPSEGATAPAAPPPGAATPGATAGLPAQLVEREETVIRWLTDLLDRVKSEGFDPQSLIQESQEAQRQLFEERARRKQLEDEVEHVKRGSVAVIKYIRSREAKVREQAIQTKDAELAELKLRLLEGHRGADGDAGAEGEGPRWTSSAESRDLETRLRGEFAARESELVEREAELRRRTVQLETEIRNLRGEAEAVRQREHLMTLDAGSLPATLEERARAVDGREKELVRRENELRSKFEEIRLAAEDVERRRAPLGFKEKELASWEQQLKMTKQALELEARRLEQIRVQSQDSPAPVLAQQAKQLEDVRTEVTRREEEVRARETFLHQKMEELEALQHKAAEWEADQMHAEAVASATETRVKSGVRRLDDLLFGGYPTGSQILLSGPAHTGKDVLSRLFIAEGLKQGVPALWVVTDKTYALIREEMTALFPPYPQFEEKGLVRYVDLYSRSLGVSEADASVRLLASNDKGVLDQLVAAVNASAAELREKAPGYRLVFESVSTLTAYLDTPTTFRFLQPFIGHRKLEGGAAYYLLETGMHTDSDLQTLEHMVDGSINLKVEQLKTFLSIRGITDAQSRAWIGFTFTKKSFSLGSFSLDHIR